MVPPSIISPATSPSHSYHGCGGCRSVVLRFPRMALWWPAGAMTRLFGCGVPHPMAALPILILPAWSVQWKYPLLRRVVFRFRSISTVSLLTPYHSDSHFFLHSHFDHRICVYPILICIGVVFVYSIRRSRRVSLLCRCVV